MKVVRVSTYCIAAVLFFAVPCLGEDQPAEKQAAGETAAAAEQPVAAETAPSSDAAAAAAKETEAAAKKNDAAGGAVKEREVLWEMKPDQENLVVEEEKGPILKDVTEEKRPLRNPFAPTLDLAKMKVEEKTAPKKKKKEVTFQQTPLDAKIPRMHLKGHLRNEEGKLLSLLEIEGGSTYIVREGDTIGLSELGQDAVIKIKKIDRLHLVVEFGRMGTVIIVR